MQTCDHYTMLGVSTDATRDEINAAFRRLAKKYHPDICRDRDAATKFKTLHVAYEILSDPAKRGHYDRLQTAQRAKPAAARDEATYAAWADAAKAKAERHWKMPYGDFLRELGRETASSAASAAIYVLGTIAYFVFWLFPVMGVGAVASVRLPSIIGVPLAVVLMAAVIISFGVCRNPDDDSFHPAPFWKGVFGLFRWVTRFFRSTS